jgi:hypothetical protein
MGYRDQLEVARIRHELRERLMTERLLGVNNVLARLRELSEKSPEDRAELDREIDRWRIRFDVLASVLATRAA